METPIYLQFTETEVFGFTGVNRITGTFTLRGDEGLHFGTLASTKMAGPNLTFEQHLHENLALVRGYYITGDTYEESTLVLFGGHGREEIILAEFTPATP
jgi:heat shock protein HslJ